jgi:hypothetical protein
MKATTDLSDWIKARDSIAAEIASMDLPLFGKNVFWELEKAQVQANWPAVVVTIEEFAASPPRRHDQVANTYEYPVMVALVLRAPARPEEVAFSADAMKKIVTRFHPSRSNQRRYLTTGTTQEPLPQPRQRRLSTRRPARAG